MTTSTISRTRLPGAWLLVGALVGTLLAASGVQAQKFKIAIVSVPADEEDARVVKEVLAAKTMPPAVSATYEWLRLGDRDLRILNLDPAAEKDPRRNEAWKEAEKARKEDRVFKYPDVPVRKWLLYSQKNPGKAEIDYFLLVRREDATKAVTEKSIKSVSIPPYDTPSLLITLTDEGKDKLAAVLGKFAPKPDVEVKDESTKITLFRYVAVAVDGKTIGVQKIPEKPDPGVLRLSGYYQVKDVEALEQTIKQLITPAKP
jgi:hypothetical protein